MPVFSSMVELSKIIANSDCHDIHIQASNH